MKPFFMLAPQLPEPPFPVRHDLVRLFRRDDALDDHGQGRVTDAPLAEDADLVRREMEVVAAVR